MTKCDNKIAMVFWITFNILWLHYFFFQRQQIFTFYSKKFVNEFMATFRCARVLSFEYWLELTARPSNSSKSSRWIYNLKNQRYYEFRRSNQLYKWQQHLYNRSLRDYCIQHKPTNNSNLFRYDDYTICYIRKDCNRNLRHAPKEKNSRLMLF